MAKPIEDEILDIIVRGLDVDDLPADEKELDLVIAELKNEHN